MRLFFILISLFSLVEAKLCYFVPPAGWEIAHLKNPSAHIKIGFIGKGSTEFRPSINLATEEVDVSLKEYLKAVKELQLGDPQVKWRDLGKFPMQSGSGRLVEMSTASPYGELKVLQAFFIKEGTAYILTSAVIKDDFPKFQSELLKAFRSLQVVNDLWTPIVDPKERDKFQSIFTSLGSSEAKEQEWQQLKNEVDSLSKLGPYWQFLALQEGREKIYTGRD